MFDHKEILNAKWVGIDEVPSYDLRDAEYIQNALDRIKTDNTAPLSTFVLR